MLRRESRETIAARLGIGSKTANFHIVNIYRKLGVNNWKAFLMLFGHFETRLVWVRNKQAPIVTILNFGRHVK